MGKKRGRNRKPSSKVEPKTIDSEPEEGQITETDEGSINSSVNSTPETGNILPQSNQSPFNDTDGSHAATSSKIVIDSAATPQQLTNGLQKSDDAEIEEGEIINSSPTITQTEKTSSEAAIGSDATSQQAVIDANIPTTQQPAADAEQSSTEESATAATTDWGAYKEPTEKTGSEVAIGSDATSQQAVVDVNIPTTQQLAANDDQPSTEEEPTDIQSIISDTTETTLRVSNITSNTKKQDIHQLFGLNNTQYLRETVRSKLFFNVPGKYRTYALITGPRHVMTQLLELDGIEYNSRKLSIEFLDKSTTPYDRVSMRKGLSGLSQSPTSGNIKAKGGIRPVSNAPSGQEESGSSINGIEDELGGTNPEEVGGGSDAIQDRKSMAQVIGEQQYRRQLEDRKRCQLLIDIWSDDEGAPFPGASMVYRLLTEQLGLSEDPSNGVKAIFTPNPNNRWRWLVLFTSEDLKTKFQGRTITLTFTDKKDKMDYTYTFITKGGIRTDPNKLMITVQSSPLIEDEELGSYLQQFGKVIAITRKTHGFAKHIDSGLRRIFLVLHNDVRTRDIPASLRTSDGVWRKLFFRGKLYTCGGCGTKHTYTEGCPTSQQDQQQNCPTSQDNQQPIPEQNATTQQTRDLTITQQNSDNTENTNDTQRKPTATQSGRNRTHTRITEHTSTKQQPNKTTEDKNNRGMENNITGTPVNSQEVDFPLSPCVVNSVTRNTPVTPLSTKDRENEVKLQKTMGKIRNNQTGIQRRRVKQTSPRCIDPRPIWRS